MKKIVAIVLIILVMSLTGMAQAEARIKTIKWTDWTDYEVDDNGVEHYYVEITPDMSETSYIQEVSREVYYELMLGQIEAQEEYESRWYVKAWKWTSTAACDVADFVVFWD